MNKKCFNFIITNFVTLLRIVGIFALIPIYKKYGGFLTFILSSFCFLTDFIDGLMARKLNSSTFFGSLFDALSDKAFLIISMILLISITPIAIIPIFFELGIAYIQSFKYNKNMNIKSNSYGKVKMWVAGIVISFSYLLVDSKFLNYLNLGFLTDISELTLFSIIFLPLVISEIITIISYIKEYFDEQKKITPKILEKRIKEEKKLEESIKNITFKDMLFQHEYYEKYKDFGNLKFLQKITSKKKA